jgi:hypothetical protein
LYIVGRETLKEEAILREEDQIVTEEEITVEIKRMINKITEEMILLSKRMNKKISSKTMIRQQEEIVEVLLRDQSIMNKVSEYDIIMSL